MGYTTDFYGQIDVKPKLNKAEIEYLTKFSETRRMKRKKGPYYIDGKGDFGQDEEPDIIDYNSSGEAPGLWCQWIPTEDGRNIEWNGGEKFYNSPEWMTWLIDHFFKPGAKGKKKLPFFNDHVLNGRIEAQGEEHGDNWVLSVTDNVVTVHSGRIVYSDTPKLVSKS